MIDFIPKCAVCGGVINEGEFKTFGLCDECLNKNYKERFRTPDGHDEETYERKDLPTAFISREELKEKIKVLPRKMHVDNTWKGVELKVMRTELVSLNEVLEIIENASKLTNQP